MLSNPVIFAWYTLWQKILTILLKLNLNFPSMLGHSNFLDVQCCRIWDLRERAKSETVTSWTLRKTARVSSIFAFISCLCPWKYKTSRLFVTEITWLWQVQSKMLNPASVTLVLHSSVVFLLTWITWNASNRFFDVSLKLVKIHLDVQFWSPYYRTDIDFLENEQKITYYVSNMASDLTEWWMCTAIVIICYMP